ncbi:MAG: VWA domain-containing protein, partial [Polyangia bacterium]|nr:VWA domain-containing protein [Polyangia bacterium]
PREAVVRLSAQEGAAKDFVLRYSMAGRGIQAGALVHAEGGEQHFLLLVSPPDRATPFAPAPREYIFVLDVSGSMAGFPLRTAKELLKDILRALRPVDRFNLVLFAGKTRVLSPRSLPVQARTLEQALGLVGEQQGAGETDLLSALRRAYELPRPPTPGLSRSVVVITDGYVGLGAETFRFVRRRLDEASCFAFGIGRSVDRALIEGLARAGRGAPFVVRSAAEAPAAGARLGRQLSSPVLSGLRVKVEGAEAYDLVPEVLPDLFVGQPLVLFGKLQGGPGRILLSGQRGAEPFELALPLPSPGASAATRPIRALWARAWATELADQLAMLPGDPGLELALGRLGVHYGLLTPMTGFVAVDRLVNRTGVVTEVVQPLPALGSQAGTLEGQLARLGVAGGPAVATETIAGRRAPLEAAPVCRRRIGGCGCDASVGGDGGAGAALWFLGLLGLLGLWLLGLRMRGLGLLGLCPWRWRRRGGG